MLNLKLICLVLLLPISVFSFANRDIPQELLGLSKIEIQNENWKLGTTKRFDVFEQFFLKHGNKAYYRAGYIYDVPNNTLLSYDNAVKVFPLLEPVLTPNKSEINVSIKEFTAFLNIELPASENLRYFFVYFDTPVKKDNVALYSYIEHPSSALDLERGRDMRLKASMLLKELNEIPGYLIKIPMTGYKPQKF